MSTMKDARAAYEAAAAELDGDLTAIHIGSEVPMDFDALGEGFDPRDLLSKLSEADADADAAEEIISAARDALGDARTAVEEYIEASEAEGEWESTVVLTSGLRVIDGSTRRHAAGGDAA